MHRILAGTVLISLLFQPAHEKQGFRRLGDVLVVNSRKEAKAVVSLLALKDRELQRGSEHFHTVKPPCPGSVFPPPHVAGIGTVSS